MGIALSPLSIAAVILALLSSRSKAVGSAYAAGWVGGISVVGVALLLMGDQFLGGRQGPSTAFLVTKSVLGAALLWLGARQLVAWRRTEGQAQETPRWIRHLDGMNASKAFVFAAAWGALQPKNLVLLAVGTFALAQSGLPPAAIWPAFAVFVAVASVSVIVPVAYYALAGERADERLDTWERWLLRNGAGLMGGLLTVIGVVLLWDAAAVLVG